MKKFNEVLSITLFPMESLLRSPLDNIQKPLTISIPFKTFNYPPTFTFTCLPTAHPYQTILFITMHSPRTYYELKTILPTFYRQHLTNQAHTNGQDYLCRKLRWGLSNLQWQKARASPKLYQSLYLHVDEDQTNEEADSGKTPELTRRQRRRALHAQEEWWWCYQQPIEDDAENWVYSIQDYPFEEGDMIIVPEAELPQLKQEIWTSRACVFTMYKWVDRKIKPVSTTFPEEARVRRTMPRDPLLSLVELPKLPPDFVPTERLTEEHMKELNVNEENFLWPEEEKLFKHVLTLNEKTLPYEEKDHGTFSQEYLWLYHACCCTHSLGVQKHSHTPWNPAKGHRIPEKQNWSRSL